MDEEEELYLQTSAEYLTDLKYRPGMEILTDSFKERRSSLYETISNLPADSWEIARCQGEIKALNWLIGDNRESYLDELIKEFRSRLKRK